MIALEYSLSFLISKCNQKAVGIANKCLSDLNLTPAQAVTLHTLLMHDEINQLTLGEKIQKDRTTTSSILQKLEENGYIKRETDPVDRRSSIIYVTQKGNDVQDKLSEKLNEINSTFSENLTNEELETLNSLLKKLWLD
ncbi:MAG: transcriptional regulator [Sedimentibacter sp.]|jgi:DNA-binding MarR family transcriptional regulator|nr:transcriptional regulator [Sedimentibacter sp.]